MSHHHHNYRHHQQDEEEHATTGRRATVMRSATTGGVNLKTHPNKRRNTHQTVVPPRHRRVHFLSIEAPGAEEVQQQPQQEHGQKNLPPPATTTLSAPPQQQSGGKSPSNTKANKTRQQPAAARPATPTQKDQTQHHQQPKKPAAPAHQNPGEHPYFKIILGASFLLTINAGMINMLTLHTTHAMASVHVTGMVARAANCVALGQWWFFTEYLVTYVCFVVGAMISGMMINHETFYLGRNYGRALFLIASVEAIALLTENTHDNSIWFIWLCAFSAGLQNGLTSKFSGNAVRTTHLTGASTDLGIAMGHILKGRQGEWWKVKLHGIAVVGFFIGGVSGFFAYERFQHSALLFNVCITTALGVAHTAYVAYHERLSPMEVLESKSDIKLHKKRVIDTSHHGSAPSSAPSSTTSAAAKKRAKSKNGGSFASAASPTSSLSALTPSSRAKRLMALASPRLALLSPTSFARHAEGIIKRRHFPKNDDENDDHRSLLKNQAPIAGVGESKDDAKRIGRPAAAGRPPLPPGTRVAPPPSPAGAVHVDMAVLEARVWREINDAVGDDDGGDGYEGERAEEEDDNEMVPLPEEEGGGDITRYSPEDLAQEALTEDLDEVDDEDDDDGDDFSDVSSIGESGDEVEEEGKEQEGIQEEIEANSRTTRGVNTAWKPVMTRQRSL